MVEQSKAGFISLFASRPDVYAEGFVKPEKPGKYGYRPVHEPLTAEVVAAHLRGDIHIGVYPLVDGRVKWFAIDFDAPKDEDGHPIADAYSVAYAEAEAQAQVLERAGLFVYIERSQSGQGCHLWGFLSEWMSAETLLLALAAHKLDAVSFDRIFPVQPDAVRGKGMGNLIALPYSGRAVKNQNSKFIDREDGTPISPMDFLGQVVLNQPAVIEEIAAGAAKTLRAKARSAVGSEESDTPASIFAAATNHDESFEGRPERPITGVLKLISQYGCRFMEHAWKDRRKLSEPEWYAAIQQLTAFQHGREAAHLISRDYKSYNAAETDAKFDQAMQNPPVGCAYIHQHFPKFACKGCPMKAPYHTAKKNILELVQESSAPMRRANFNSAVERARLRNTGVEKAGIKYGLPTLDAVTSLRNSELTVFGAMPSMGKAQPLTARVLTPTGWTTMAQLKVGDRIIGSSGQPVTVVGVYPQGIKPAYRVTTVDGRSTETCDEHLWLTRTNADHVNGTPGSVKTLREIMETLRAGQTPRLNHRLPDVPVVTFDAPSEPLPMHPYLLGVLLGDGSMCGTSVMLSSADQEIIDAVKATLPETDAIVFSDRYNWRIRRATPKGGPMGSGVRRYGSETKDVLTALDLTGKRAWDKHIPAQFLTAGIDDRWALLRGLMDTDGSANARGAEYTTTSPQLRDDVIALVRSLGGRAVYTARRTSYVYKGETRRGRESYRLRVSFFRGETPFALPRKALKYRESPRERHQLIESIEYVGDVEQQCIAVDAPDHLYVTDDFILTHNTAFMIDAAAKIAAQDVPALVFSAETAEGGLFERFLAHESGIDSKALRGERFGAISGELLPLTDDEWVKLDAARDRLNQLPLFVNFTDINADQVLNNIERVLLENGIGFDDPYVVFFDYLQFGAKLGGESNYERVSRLSTEFKNIAKITNHPIVIFSQLVRDAEEMEAPSLTMFKESGRIEQDADVALILSGERLQGRRAPRRITVVKQREGESQCALDFVLQQDICHFDPRANTATTTQSRPDLLKNEPADLFG